MKCLSRGPERVAAFPDLHAPFTDKRALEKAIQIAYDFNPTRVILLGDTFDCLALSGYRTAQDAALDDDWVAELYSSLTVLERIEAMRADLNISLEELLGNHEERAGRSKNVPVQWQRALDINRVCPEIGKIRTGPKWHIHPYKRSESLHVGGLVFMHGFGHGTTAGEKDALRARQELARLKKVYPEVVVVRGHQHALVPLHGGGPLPVRCRGIHTGTSWCSPGTLGPTSCGWDQNVNDTEWGPGIFLGETSRSGAVIRADVIPL